MHRKMSVLLLLGAIILLLANRAHAQDKSAAQGVLLSPHEISVALTFSETHARSTSDFYYWMTGGGAQFNWQFLKNFSVVGDFNGAHTGKIGNTGTGLDILTLTAGPRVTLHSKSGRFGYYGQALVGEAWGFNGVFPGALAPTSSASSIAILAGGGVNMNFKHRLSLRLIEADWERTQMSNAVDTQQDNLRLSTGVVWRFH